MTNSGMRADPDFFGAFECPDREVDLPPVDPCYFGLPADQASNRCRREMAHVNGGADRALAGIEIRPDCVERGVFHDHDHYGSG